MAIADAHSPSRRRLTARASWWLAGFGLLAALVAWWSWRAFHETSALDTGLAYQGGQLAWTTGHPEHLHTWISTPFLGCVMALASRLMSSDGVAVVNTILNIGCVIAVAAYVLRALRTVLSPLWWWICAFGLLSFAPMMSSVWWKQFNVVALALALAGFELIRRHRDHPGGALIGLSLAIKPLVLLLPVILLVRRGTRRAGVFAVTYAVGLNVLGQVFMSWRAHSLSALNVLPVLKDFADRAKPANVWACVPENFAPGSLMCRLWGGSHWTLEHVIVWAFVALLAVWVFDALRGLGPRSWEVFAFTCALSTMVSPIAWSHYQIMLAPLFVLLLVRFSREGAPGGAWAGLAAAFILCALMWQPFGTLISAIQGIVSGTPASEDELLQVEEIAQFAQYVVLITGILWYTRAQLLRRPTGSSVPPSPRHS